MTTDSNAPPSNPLKEQINLTIRFLFEFLKNPIHKIAHLPEWGWFHLMSLLVVTSLISGILAGLVSRNIYHFLFGLLLLPTITLITEFVLTSFFYYYFQVFERRIVSFQKLWTLVIFANIPFFLFQVVSGLIAAMTLVGFAFTGLLLVVGLSENFQMKKQRALRLILTLYTVVFLVWLWGQVDKSVLDRKTSIFSSGSESPGPS